MKADVKQVKELCETMTMEEKKQMIIDIINNQKEVNVIDYLLSFIVLRLYS